MIFTSDIKVQLIQSVGGDHMVVSAAKVSTTGEECLEFAQEGKEEGNFGLINYLMKHRHGCYDESTDVLTKDGWKNWKYVDGTEEFCTLNPHTNIIEYQKATDTNLGIDYTGDMYHVLGNGIDLLVNSDHALYACKMTTLSGRKKESFNFYQARELHMVNHCHKKDGIWFYSGDSLFNEYALKLLGFAIGDGYVTKTTAEFHLKKSRKISYLFTICEKLGIKVIENKNNSTFRIEWPFTFCIYNQNKEKIIPQSILYSSNSKDLEHLLDGLMNSDGSIDNTHQSYTTTSPDLAGQIQQLALHVGLAANCTIDYEREGAFGTKPLYRLNIIYRNLKPEVNRLDSSFGHTELIKNWSGKIYCVTVPNHTLYVRRNGKPVWSGNTPFEHGSLTFFVHAPIFVWREWHRHRIGFSYNEESGRYKTLEPVFYISPPDRPMMKIDDWKPGRPKFLVGDQLTYEQLCYNLKRSYELAYEMYQKNLALGIDPGLARDCLPVGIYSGCWVTCNPRSMMAFLSLRTHEPDAKFVSYPLYEIEIAARKCEEIFAKEYPLTYKAFLQNGRVAP